MAETKKAAAEHELAGDFNNDSEYNDWDQESSGGSLHRWDKPGQKVTGLLTDKRIAKTQLGEMTVYDILTKDGEVAVPGTKGLNDLMKKYPANSSVIVEIEFVEEKKGNFPNPFKVFKVRAAASNENRLASLGISVFGAAETSQEGQ